MAHGTFQKTVICGHIGSDPVLRTTPDGTAMRRKMHKPGLSYPAQEQGHITFQSPLLPRKPSSRWRKPLAQESLRRG